MRLVDAVLAGGEAARRLRAAAAALAHPDAAERIAARIAALAARRGQESRAGVRTVERGVERWPSG